MGKREVLRTWGLLGRVAGGGGGRESKKESGRDEGGDGDEDGVV
jgi:hypothetical protein